MAAVDDSSSTSDGTNIGEEILHFLAHVLRRSEELLKMKDALISKVKYLDDLLLHLDLLDQTMQLLSTITSFIIDPDDLKAWRSLESIFGEIEHEFKKLFDSEAINTHTTVPCVLPLLTIHDNRPGRPAFLIPRDILEELRGHGFSWKKISEMFQVSRWTIMRRVHDFGLSNLKRFSEITDETIDNTVKQYIAQHGTTTGESFIIGHFRSLGLHVQRRRIRASINRVDPSNSALRWGALVSRRKYFVPWPNSLWHLDGHHALIRWKFVIHGCCDGKSRKIMFLKCNTNNLAETVLYLFEEAITENGSLWPSRIRVDYGVENVLACEAMVARRGEGRGSFIAGSSTRNQRIERLWRDVFRCVCQFFYYHFYAMEQTGILDIENPIHMFALHLVFQPRINNSLNVFKDMFNNHGLSTESGWTPNQIWLNGMLNENNPLSKNGLDDIDADTYYGEDPEGPFPRLNFENNVVIEPVEISHADELSEYIYRQVDPNMNSSQAGIDVYEKVLSLVVEKLQTLSS